MKNAGLAGAIALCGIGLIMIGLGNFVSTQRAMAAAPAVVSGDGEPTVVWYGTENVAVTDPSGGSRSLTGSHAVYRAWSDGTIEVRLFGQALYNNDCVVGVQDCVTPWVVIASPNEGLNAAADITFDEVVDGQDLATLLASWGDAPRNPMPPSDCPLGLLN